MAVLQHKYFPFYSFSGTHYEIGRQYGETCKALIHKHLELALRRLKDRINTSNDNIFAKVMNYRPFVQKYAKFLDDEICGMAESTKLSLNEIYFLQLRAEIYRDLEVNDECTTYTLSEEVTSDNKRLIGQNADLPALYSSIAIVAEIIPENGIPCLMLTPAGQLSYIGINAKGMGVFANFLNCKGWRCGFPRYMFTRFCLQYDNVEAAYQALRTIRRASSRNLIMSDNYGGAVDLETTPEQISPLYPHRGIITHTNHFLAKNLLSEEQQSTDYLVNTKTRLKQINYLLEKNYGNIDVKTMQTILRNRATYPNALCRELGDSDSDTITFASVIASPSEQEMWIAIGPPNRYCYKRYTFSK